MPLSNPRHKDEETQHSWFLSQLFSCLLSSHLFFFLVSLSLISRLLSSHRFPVPPLVLSPLDRVLYLSRSLFFSHLIVPSCHLASCPLDHLLSISSSFIPYPFSFLLASPLVFSCPCVATCRSKFFPSHETIPLIRRVTSNTTNFPSISTKTGK